MRQGELLALRWNDVDLENAIVRVRRSFTGDAVGTPKNRERRDVDLISDVVKLLTRMHAIRANDDGEALIFHTGDSLRFISPTIVLRRQLYPALEAAGIARVGPTQENRTFHSFRHTFAKRALENGAQVTWLSEVAAKAHECVCRRAALSVREYGLGTAAQTGKAPSILAAWSFRSARSQWP